MPYAAYFGQSKSRKSRYLKTYVSIQLQPSDIHAQVVIFISCKMADADFLMKNKIALSSYNVAILHAYNTYQGPIFGDSTSNLLRTVTSCMRRSFWYLLEILRCW